MDLTYLRNFTPARTDWKQDDLDNSRAGLSQG